MLENSLGMIQRSTCQHIWAYNLFPLALYEITAGG